MSIYCQQFDEADFHMLQHVIDYAKMGIKARCTAKEKMSFVRYSLSFLRRITGRIPKSSCPRRLIEVTGALPRLLPRQATQTVSGSRIWAVSV